MTALDPRPVRERCRDDTVSLYLNCSDLTAHESSSLAACLVREGGQKQVTVIPTFTLEAQGSRREICRFQPGEALAQLRRTQQRDGRAVLSLNRVGAPQRFLGCLI